MKAIRVIKICFLFLCSPLLIIYGAFLGAGLLIVVLIDWAYDIAAAPDPRKLAEDESKNERPCYGEY